MNGGQIDAVERGREKLEAEIELLKSALRDCVEALEHPGNEFLKMNVTRAIKRAKELL